MKASYRLKQIKIASRGGHIANKKESALLRKIMSDTGKTEEEIREIYKYRKALSEAAKPAPSTEEAKQKKYYKNVIRQACNLSGFWPSHPESLEQLRKLMGIYGRGLTFNEIVKRYIK